MNTARPLLALLSATSLVAAAACDQQPVDDPAPALTNCQVVWASPGSTTGRFDVFILDMPIENWTTGTKAYDRSIPGKEISGIFHEDMLVSSNLYLSRGVTTSGEFSVVTTGTAAGTELTVTDAGGQLFFDLDGQDQIGPQNGSGGAFEFHGVWSDPDPDASPDPGDVGGSARLTWKGVLTTAGTYTRYAVCYDANE